jgi:acyl carrier protein
MGLDSIELVMEIENYFRISITDAEAGQIQTVQQMLDCVADRLHLKSEDSSVRDRIFQKLAACLNGGSPLREEDLLVKYLDCSSDPDWKALLACMGMEIPRPPATRSTFQWLGGRFAGLSGSPAIFDQSAITLVDFAAAILAANRDRMLDPARIRSRFEIYAALIALTAEKTGVDYFEVRPDKSFGDDLGLD